VEPRYSRPYLIKEYLRRSAWWSQATGQSDWFPFFDIAAAVDPSVRADPAVMDQVSAFLGWHYGTGALRTACLHALHFAALLDAGTPLPEAPDLPFEPLVVLLERGGGFTTESGFIDVDLTGIRPGELEDNLLAEPWVQLDKTFLDAVDEAGADWRAKAVRNEHADYFGSIAADAGRRIRAGRGA